jgi:hypothetical protein
MKRATLIGVLVSLAIGVVNIPSIVSAQDRGYDRRNNWWEVWRDSRNDQQGLEGTWYLNGDRYKKTEIVTSRRGLVARNENGHTTRLEIGRGGDVYARDWQGGLRGDVRRGRIQWDNGTTWTREPHYRTARYR